MDRSGTPRRWVVTFAFALLCCLPAAAVGQAPEVERLDRSLRGNHLLVTYREGEVLYGTYYFLDVHYCSSGQYVLYGKSRKQTVLGNEQLGNWQEAGAWTVSERQGQVGVQYQPRGGAPNFVPARVLPDGAIWAGEGVSIVRQGPAQC